ncbi:Archaemetzincin-1 [Saguinus oedipus]|uniref:Archaemetzincin-1 n=1 Tax=Saguinus oedipus TaxID=9490 RepID=A0ABQ9W5W9_SAGOE|nr:Archaemetzincin-1 [Saguinus oedipus]
MGLIHPAGRCLRALPGERVPGGQGHHGAHSNALPPDLSEEPVGSSLLHQLRSCTEAFFLGLHVKCLPSVAATSIRCCSRPSRDSDRLQLHTGQARPLRKEEVGGRADCGTKT